MIEGLSEVYRAEGEIEASVIRSRLESYGVPCLLQSNGAPSVHVVPFTRLSVTKVMVPTPLAERAREIIAEVPSDVTRDDLC